MPPPPLALQCAPSRAWRNAGASLCAAALAALALWAAGHLGLTAFAAGVGAAAAAAGGAILGLHLAGPMRTALIRWDGQGWEVDGVCGDLQVMLDLGRGLLLLRLLPIDPGGRGGRGAARWVAASFARGSGDHRALRTALYSRPPEAGPTTPRVRPPDRVTD